MKEKIQKLLMEVLAELQEDFTFVRSDYLIERPKNEQFGDYTSNVALIAYADFAHALDSRANEEIIFSKGNLDIKNPITLAEKIRKKIEDKNTDFLERIEVAGAGHINFYLSQKVLTDVLAEVIEKDVHFGDAEIGKEEKVNNEFISANPTGPLHLGNGRGGFYGDALARILRKAGYEVVNEYYVNDAGEQVEKLGHSVLKDEEAVYTGDYINELNSQFAIRNSQFDPREVGERAADYVLEKMIKPTVSGKMGIVFDSWISEKRDIVEAGLVDRAIGALKEKGLTFESEGALWLRTTDFGDDKDRVLVKSDGTRTYFASDCGYILHKKERGFSRLILTLGADHHGYRARLLAAAKALSFDGGFDFTFVQLVRLMKDGKEVRMSKRAGNVVTIDELLEKIPADVVRFFFLMYSPDTHMNFDLGLAEERSAKNPVYYVQYAHARLASIIRKAEEAGMSPKDADLSMLSHPKEQAILRELAFFSELVADAAKERAPHKLPQYAIRLADRLHSFYDGCKVIDPDNPELSRDRLALVSGVKVVLGETLGLMGVSAPERMEQGSDKGQATRNKEEETKINT